MICPACETLRCSLDFSRKQELLFHSSVSNLQLSSESGCHMCRMIYTDLCNKFNSALINRSCRVLIKTVENKGFWISLEPELGEVKEDSPVGTPNFDIGVCVDRLEVPSKSYPRVAFYTPADPVCT